MILWLKRIRQKLIQEGKLRTYLLYAIGEVLLVMIGILLALAVNNKNELSKQRGIEMDILSGIRSDLQKDTIDVNFNLESYKWMVGVDSILLDHLVNEKPYNREIGQLLAVSTLAKYTLVLHRSYFEEAKVKGLSMISNQNLRDQISRLYEFTYVNAERSENDENQLNMSSIRAKVYDYLEMVDNGFPASTLSIEYAISPEKYSQLLLDQGFITQLAGILALKKFHITSVYQPLQMEILALIDELNKELKD